MPADGQRHRLEQARYGSASMGPRGFARGWTPIEVEQAKGEAQLQWGRGGLPADGIRRWKKSVGLSVLQWGRGGLPADGSTTARVRIPLLHCFNGAAGVCPRMVAGQYSPRTTPKASMGPRGFARGWSEQLGKAAICCRGFNGAAGVCPRMARCNKTSSTLPTQLQWGRGGLPADGVLGTVERKAMNRLQWGRGGLPADGIDTGALSVKLRLASMGPRGFARGWLTSKDRISSCT